MRSDMVAKLYLPGMLLYNLQKAEKSVVHANFKTAGHYSILVLGYK